MILKVRHNTYYNFEQQVYLEPHFLRFKPRLPPNVKFIKSELTITPTPAGRSEQRDYENNLIHFCWFEGMHSRLRIQSESIFEMDSHNPYNFLIFPDTFSRLPFAYTPTQADLLHGSLEQISICKSLIDFGKKILSESSGMTISFIANLTRQINLDFELVIRIEGEPLSPDKTYEKKEGSCRDLAWMQIALLRHFGIAARFVSGYFFVESENPEHDLHGWLEVYLPGAGWMGFDPSNGGATGTDHIPVSASAVCKNTMPVTGTVRGGAKCTMEASVTLIKYKAVVF